MKELAKNQMAYVMAQIFNLVQTLSDKPKAVISTTWNHNQEAA